jgi:GrpB-like predicted nucleotidyltransferase (UPF0157 family)
MSVTLSECHDTAVEIFANEASNIRSIVGENFVDIHHIGSTAVPGLLSKPRVDIALEVNNLDESLALKEKGYVFKGELNIPFRYFFGKNNKENGINLHVCEKGNPEIKGFLTFRNYMREHPKAVAEYAALKQKIAATKEASVKKSYGLPKYTLMKNEFIREILRKAGFKEPCVRYPVHYNEIEYIGEVDPYLAHVVFYEGPDLIGSANICEKSREIERFRIEKEQFHEYFWDKVKKIAKRTKTFDEGN